MTNYDRIKAMSVEEMSDVMMCPAEAGLWEFECERTDDCNCFECIKKWLESEADVKQ